MKLDVLTGSFPADEMPIALAAAGIRPAGQVPGSSG